MSYLPSHGRKQLNAKHKTPAGDPARVARALQTPGRRPVELHCFARERPMTRADLTEKILDIKREKGWSWKH
ncbi:MAG TPA: hypothetical protein VG100_05550, partial [Xanthobacteraceae bacterium]|nr:hypothetical protein [Xanthobacteraceae bacterium]